MKCVLDSYPDLDPDISEYMAGMLEDIDIFDTASDVLEAVGPFLMDAANASETDVQILSDMLFEMMKVNKKTYEPLKLTGGSVLFSDQAVDSSATDDVMLVTDVELRSQVDQKKVEKENKRRQKKMAAAEAAAEDKEANKDKTLVKELAVASQSTTKGQLSTTGDIVIDNFDLTFGSVQLIQGAELNLAKGKRYGLVGRNGAGKSTLLRALESRSLQLPSNISLLHVEQEVIGDDTPALEAVLDVLAERRDLLKELKVLEDGNGEATGRMTKIHERLMDIDADTKPSMAAEILHGLGFTRLMQEAPTSSFSGGWRMRLALAQALLLEPDLLLLDEPTNMLDMRAVLWLEYKLQQWPNTLLTVSHDRSYLNTVCTDIIHLNAKKLDYYKGDYDTFEKTRGERHKQQMRDYDAQKQYRDHLQVFIDRFRYNANRAAQVQSKIKIIDKLPVIYPPEAPEEVKLNFSPAEEDIIGGTLLQIDNVTFQYSEKTRVIFEEMDLSCNSDSRIAIVGENGAGKSTLLKLLLQRLQPTKGFVTVNRNCRTAYFAQHHIEDFDLSQSPIEILQKHRPGKTAEEYRRILGGFGCVGDLATRKMNVLSGGQKSRVAFARLAIIKPHLLILDEPTNHLDIESVAALGEAIKAFKGGVVLVSHDERLISVACKEVWYCGDQKVTRIEGGLDAYRAALLADFTKGGINRAKE